MLIDDQLLYQYKEDKVSDELVARYAVLIDNLAKLCKGRYKPNDPIFRWFYGMFLGTQQKTSISLLNIRDKIRKAMRPLSMDDCYNQVVCFFLEQAKRYKKYKNKKIRFHQYIRIVLGWKVKNWVDTYCTQLKPIPIHDVQDCVTEEVEPFCLSLEWVLYGSNNPLFRRLIAYERYLLYLYFVESMDIREIASSTFQSKNTVNADLLKIFEKVKKA